MWKKTGLSCVILVCIYLIIISACSLFHPGQVEFDINHPPKGWYRFVDPNLNYTVWLSEDWEPILDDPNDDFNLPTRFQLANHDLAGNIGIRIIPPVDFQKDYCNPLTSECDNPPTKTYNIEVGGISIPCARYAYGTYSSTHLCVVGRYTGQRFQPLWQNQQISFLLNFQATNELEKELETDWKQIVMSFVLEQPPDIK
jgi:hypothetical protein